MKKQKLIILSILIVFSLNAKGKHERSLDLRGTWGVHVLLPTAYDLAFPEKSGTNAENTWVLGLEENKVEKTGDYIFDNITLNAFEAEISGAPVITSFEVKLEEQGESGVKQIIGRVEASDIEGDPITYQYSIESGNGSITLVDETSFIYNENGSGTIVFKVTATDSNQNSSSELANYTVVSYDDSLYFDSEQWGIAVKSNGYTTTNSAFLFTENNPDLPNVILFGNSISIGYTKYTRENLAGIANVYRIPNNGGSTLRMLDDYEIWLSNINWDVIHFNWGLHDLKYLLNNVLDVTGKQEVPVAEYAENMETIVEILKSKSDKLIFATTSYIPEGSNGRINGDEIIYNNAALEVMNNYPEILIDDQYSLSYDNQDKQMTENVHFFAAGYSLMGKQAADKIKEALNVTSQINIALDGVATQSTTLNDAEASRAIDDNTDGVFARGSVIAAAGPDAWWQVELDNTYNINEINVFNRTNCCEERLADFTVYVLNGTTVTYEQRITTIPDPLVTLNAGGAVGNIVRVESNITATLNIAEVEVYGDIATLSIEDNEVNDKFSVHPNPVSNNITVDFKGTTAAKLEIFDYLGKTVMSSVTVEYGSNTFDISNLASGLYIIKVSDEKEAYTRKIIKK